MFWPLAGPKTITRFIEYFVPLLLFDYSRNWWRVDGLICNNVEILCNFSLSLSLIHTVADSLMHSIVTAAQQYEFIGISRREFRRATVIVGDASQYLSPFTLRHESCLTKINYSSCSFVVVIRNIIEPLFITMVRRLWLWLALLRYAHLSNYRSFVIRENNYD